MHVVERECVGQRATLNGRPREREREKRMPAHVCVCVCVCVCACVCVYVHVTVAAVSNFVDDSLYFPVNGVRGSLNVTITLGVAIGNEDPAHLAFEVPARRIIARDAHGEVGETHGIR